MAADHWKDNEYLEYICKNGVDIEKIDEMVVKNVDFNQVFKYGETPLYLACVKNYPSVVAKLLSVGADANLNCRFGSILYPVLFDANFKILKILIDFGLDLNQMVHEDTIMTFSVKYSSQKIILFLIEKGCDIHKHNTLGLAPLFYAINNDDAIITEKLIQCGADTNELIPSNYGLPADIHYIHKVCIEGYPEMLKILIKYGADVNLKTKHKNGVIIASPLFQLF